MGSRITRDHHLWTRDTIKNVSGDITLDVAGDITLDASGKQIYLARNGTNYVDFDFNTCVHKFRHFVNTDDLFSIAVEVNGVTTLATVDDDTAVGHLTLQPDGDLVLDPVSGVTKFLLAGDPDDLCTLTVAANGATTLSTTDSDGADGHLTLAPDGRLIVDLNSAGLFTWIDKDIDNTDATTNKPALFVDYDRVGSVSTGTDINTALDIQMDVTGASGGTITSRGLLMDVTGDSAGGGTSTNYGIDLNVNGADNNYGIDITVPDVAGDYHLKLMAADDVTDYCTIATAANGATTLRTVDTTGGNDGGHLTLDIDGHVEFDGCGVGFDLVTPAYNASDTDVDFTTGNKQLVTFDSGNITDLNLIFPDTSGNFVLLLKQDGTGGRTVTYYKAWDLVNSDAADGSTTVKFAGGSNPDLTDDANHVDIISIFWDADNEIAYGVATLDFQF